jgi:hypothetical protein
MYFIHLGIKIGFALVTVGLFVSLHFKPAIALRA